MSIQFEDYYVILKCAGEQDKISELIILNCIKYEDNGIKGQSQQ